MSYQRTLQRIVAISIVLAAAGGIAALALRGAGPAAGFVIGAGLSFLNYRWWISVANAIGGSGKTPLGASAIILALRYLLIAAIVYGIVKILKITPVAIFAGLLVSVAAVILEVLYESVISKENHARE